MSDFMIRQGKHDPTVGGGTYEVIKCKKVKGVIQGVKAHKYFGDKAIDVEVKILEPAEYKGRTVFGDATFDPTDDFSWTYVNLRYSAGIPYDENEPADFNIGAALQDRIVWMELYARKGKGENKDKEYQAVKWLTDVDTSQASQVTSNQTNFSKEENKNIDNMFGDADSASLDKTAPPSSPKKTDDWL